MNMTKKDLDKFARNELAKTRFVYDGWQIKGDKLLARCKLEDAHAYVETDLPAEVFLNSRTLTNQAKKAVRTTWPRLVDWMLMGDGKLCINHENAEGEDGTLTVNLPKDEPVVPPVVDDELAEATTDE